MPRRPRRLRRRAGRLRRAGAPPRGRLPRRQPRPRGARRPAARRVLARRRAGRPLDAGDDRPATASTTWPRSSRRSSTRRSASTTPARATRSGSTCSPPLLAELCLDALQQRVACIGHSHVALAFSRREGEPADRRDAPRGRRELDIGGGEWLLNPGSVGQPRDGDPRAAWLLLDTDAWTRALPPHRVRRRRRRGGDPRRAPAGLAGRAARARSVGCGRSMRSLRSAHGHPPRRARVRRGRPGRLRRTATA